MNLEEWNAGAGAPETKPTFNPVVYTLEAQDIEVHGRLVQEGDRTTPFGVWACTNEVKTSATTPAFALGTAVGSPSIPATSLYGGNTYRAKLSGTWTTAGADTMTVRIADLAGTFVYAEGTVYTGGAVTDEPWSAEFEIQIQAIGGAGVGKLASSASTVRSATAAATVGVAHVNDSLNVTTFNSTGGIYLAPYIGVGVNTSTVTRHAGYCVSLY